VRIDLRSVLVSLAWLAAGCGSSHGETDAGRTPDSGGAMDSGGASDSGGSDARPFPDAEPRACGDSMCGPGEICITGRCEGCCDLPPACIPIPSGCAGSALACDCFAADPCGGCTTCQSVTSDAIVCGSCVCMCAAPWTPIDTPSGARPIAELREGDLVYSVDDGEVTVVPIARVVRRSVARHAVVHITLVGGGAMDVSGSHPTADGRRLDALEPGDWLGSAHIASIELVPYDEPFTYDILPASDTGTYFVAGAPIGSTLYSPR